MLWHNYQSIILWNTLAGRFEGYRFFESMIGHSIGAFIPSHRLDHVGFPKVYKENKCVDKGSVVIFLPK